MHDQRLTSRLNIYWNNLRKSDDIPSYKQFNSSAIADIWQSCILFTVVPSAPGQLPSLTFTTIGDNLRAVYGANAIGMVFHPKQRHFQGAAIVGKLDVLIANPVPLIDIGQFISERGKMVKYRSCLLPFGGQGVLTHVVAGLSWKEF